MQQPPQDPVFIVDNSDSNWKVRSYLLEWCDLSRAMDIATGYFEIGALLALEEKWQRVDKIRLLMGDEVSLRTKRAFAEGLRKISSRLDDSVEGEKAKNDFLAGVPAIVEALRSGRIECRVYRRDKFHAKAYLTHGRSAVVGSFALVGSSNFTYPGLSDNVELNVQIRGPEVTLLQEWYERHWQDAEDVTPDILRTLERHTSPQVPFTVWAKALHEYFAGRALSPDEWDQQQSVIWKMLARYQRDAYKNLVSISSRYGAAFLCDGVGLGKTYVGLMLIERFVLHEGKRVVLFAPKAAREDVWEPVIESLLPGMNSGFVSIVIYNHTDLQRSGRWPRDIQRTIADADVIIMDEAHHFRNPGIAGEGEKEPSRYRKLQQYVEGAKKRPAMFFLTATPVNNSVHDFRHILELATGGDPAWFSSGTRNLGIHNLRAHFILLEKKLLGISTGDATRDLFEADEQLREERVFKELVVQRSRGYVKASQKIEESGEVLFPVRETPQVIAYNLKKTYEALLESVEKAFSRKDPLFVLSIYYPMAYPRGERLQSEAMTFDEGRQKQVVSLIRTLFLKRFESSAKAFEGSCWRLLQKLFAWVSVHAEDERDKARLHRWKVKHDKLIHFVHEHQMELWPEHSDESGEDDFVSDEMLEDVERLDPELYDVGEIIEDCIEDMNQLAEFLELLAKVDPKRDDKLQALIRQLKTDRVLKSQKVLLFTEFAETARYLERELAAAGICGIQRIDGSSTQKQRSAVIRRFSPYYNRSDSAAAEAAGGEIRILIATDVLAEGLNLQDATRLINYDLHWNPVRLMQRIGRVDRRMNPKIEAAILKDHPEQKPFRGRTAYWNMLPPDELEALLRLYERVNKKTLVISRTFGIEGRKLLHPDDDFDPVKEMNEQFDGKKSSTEELRLEYEALLRDHPELAASLPGLPLKTFSGKAHPAEGARAVFFCYRIPAPDGSLVPAEDGSLRWSDSAGTTVWLCADLEGDRILTDPAEMAGLIRSTPDTARQVKLDRAKLSTLRQKMDKHLTQQHLRPLQAPPGVTPVLKCWMELN